MGHSAGARQDLFCAQRKEKCDKDQQQYRVNCAVSWTYQAHHVLCVASVTQYLASNTDVVEVVKLTDWCINTADNMLAMPPYFSSLLAYYLPWKNDMNSAAVPAFNNLPVHGYGHPAYKREIDKKMEQLAEQVAEATEAHQEVSNNLKAQLDTYRNHMKKQLEEVRGKRGAGTHNEWVKASQGNAAEKWYEPFCMADDPDVEARTFPPLGLSPASSVTTTAANLI